MYTALNYWVFGGFAGEKTPFEFIDWAKEKGLDGVELTVGDCLSIDITEEEFNSQMKADMEELNAMFEESHKLEEEIQKQLATLKFCE